jgi:hypothetical protein
VSHALLNEDFIDLLRALTAAGVRFIVVGAHAMAVHGVPRATGDLDIWVRPAAGNAARVMEALEAFGPPVRNHGVTASDFEIEGTVYQIGLPPRRIDLLTAITGVDFDAAWAERLEVEIAGVSIPFLGRRSLILNKRATGREKDILDVHLLERSTR